MRILLVEDDARLRRVLAQGLREVAHAVDEAQSIAEALGLVHIESHEVLIVDVNLPDGSGFDLTRRLRAEGVRTPILHLTARDSVEDRVTGLDAGADDYLVKPFALDELLARLRALARRPGEALPTRFEVADLSVDPASRVVTVHGQALDLTTTEYALLEVMARHADEVLTRERISDRVWDENYDPLSNIIDVYVARLRRKLAAADANARIQTVRGVGYRLAAASSSA